MPHYISVSIDLGELAMLEVITAKRLYAYAPRSQIWPEYKLKTASCFNLLTGKLIELTELMHCLRSMFAAGIT